MSILFLDFDSYEYFGNIITENINIKPNIAYNCVCCILMRIVYNIAFYGKSCYPYDICGYVFDWTKFFV